MSKRYENLEKIMCEELERLDKKYASQPGEMNIEDAKKADMLYHALKSAETYHAMHDAQDEWEDEESGADGRYRDGRGRSYAQRRDPRTGRYMRSYGYPDWPSGRYPMEYIDPYWDRR